MLLALLVALAVLVHHDAPAAMADAQAMPMAATGAPQNPVTAVVPVGPSVSSAPASCAGSMQTCTAAGVVTSEFFPPASACLPATGPTCPTASALALHADRAHARSRPPESSTVLRI
ncbi:hypothetical protein [Streptacidiphilus sp. MAP12-20]|uniref:hypothetical protein n=1 Tax=Streptacidiphilus sp. MAP12-20 TaxID=3156299 RepID=UPI003513748F